MEKKLPEIVQHLSKFVLPERLNKFQNVLSLRTRYITVVLEDIFQAQNASAVLRTCDCFGVQDVHIIENKNRYKLNPDVVVGSSKWLSIKHYNTLENNTLQTINSLRSQGYRIAATSPHKNDICINNYDLNKGKTALFFGSELPGLSELVLDNADEFVKIPMYGFTESYNISVSAALCMQQLRNSLNSSSIHWQLSQQEQWELLFQWLMGSIKSGQKILDKYLSDSN
jgi:tRNA (guanosine-2'-O-)-methyltransferase